MSNLFPITRGALVGVVVALVISLGGFVLAYSGYESGVKAARFDAAVCTLATRQAQNSSAFVELLSTLEARAVAREHLDEQVGNASAVAADADSARLYAFVLASYKGQPRGGSLPC
jgi:hypothetical protein